MKREIYKETEMNKKKTQNQTCMIKRWLKFVLKLTIFDITTATIAYFILCFKRAKVKKIFEFDVRRLCVSNRSFLYYNLQTYSETNLDWSLLLSAKVHMIIIANSRFHVDIWHLNFDTILDNEKHKSMYNHWCCLQTTWYLNVYWKT